MTTSAVWRWESFDAAGERRTGGVLDGQHVWWATGPQQVAEYMLAKLLIRAGEDRAGWSITAWRDGAESEVGRAAVDDWLPSRIVAG